jgi:uncharacterized protein (DUF2141 family)
MTPSLILLASVLTGTTSIPLASALAPCQPGAGGPAILVKVEGLRKRTGSLRVQLHGSDAATWLEKGKWMQRIEVPVTGSAMAVCLKVPSTGRYAIAVRHDEDGDGKTTAKDGGGYSRNPHLTIFDVRPSYGDASFVAGPGVTTINVVMNYLSGLRIGPVKGH